MDKTNGYDNEYEFVKLFNNKKVRELDPISQDLINNIFNYKSDDSIITCWRNHQLQKADILIRLENHIKGISIKKGSRNSVHAEGLHYFILFLKENNVPTAVIREYLRYHYGDGTTNGKGEKRISAEDYKKENADKINLINNAFKDEKFITNCIKRFITVGTNGLYPISALIYGEPNDYIFITTAEIEQIIISQKNYSSSGVNIGPLQIQPKNRCLNHNPAYEKDRLCIQVKWYNILDNYLEYKYNTQKKTHTI